MLKLFKKFVKEEEGSVVEYIIVLAVIAVILAMVFPSLREWIGSWFNDATEGVSKGIGGSTADPKVAKPTP